MALVLNDAEKDVYEERAAIMEYDGGMERNRAELAAKSAIARMRRECYGFAAYTLPAC